MHNSNFRLFLRNCSFRRSMLFSRTVYTVKVLLLFRVIACCLTTYHLCYRYSALHANLRLRCTDSRLHRRNVRRVELMKVLGLHSRSPVSPTSSFSNDISRQRRLAKSPTEISASLCISTSRCSFYRTGTMTPIQTLLV